MSKWVWHDCMSSEPEKAKAFYTALFGWKVEPWEMGPMGTYDSLKVGDHGFGGIVQLEPSLGVPSHWMCYLEVPGKLDDATATITALGGGVTVPKFEVPGVGFTSMVHDPQGAHFAAFEFSDPAGMGGMPQPAPGTPGMIIWHELMTADTAAAAEFYGQFTGWTSHVEDMGTGPYTLLNEAGADHSGIMTLPEGLPMPAWVIYFMIAQPTMDAALDEVRRLGGIVGMGPMHIPGVGTIAACADPTGAWFNLMLPEMPSPGA